MTDPAKVLAAAFRDPAEPVRLGAAFSAQAVAPKQAARLLGEHARALKPSAAAAETAALALALARVGGDPLPLVASLLKTEPSVVVDWLTAGYAAWLNALEERVAAGVLPAGPARLLAQLGSARSGKLLPLPGHGPWLGPEAAISVLEHSPLELKSSGSTGYFGSAVRALGRGDLDLASQQLVSAAVTEHDPRRRTVASQALSRLGWAGARPLVALIKDELRQRPGGTMLGSSDRETGSRAFRAAEALTVFKDVETALNLVRLAAPAQTGTPIGREAFAGVLAGMRAETVLPAITWAGWGLHDAQQRQEAVSLLDRILHQPSSFGVLQPQGAVAPRAPERRTLDWLPELVGRPRSQLSWGEDPSVAISVLGSAITATTEMEGNPGEGMWDLRSRLRAAREDAFSKTLQKSLQKMSHSTSMSIVSNFGSDRKIPPEFPPVTPAVSHAALEELANAMRDHEPKGQDDNENIPAGYTYIAQFIDHDVLPLERLARYPRCGFPARCQLDEAALLSVRLLPAAADGTSPPFDVPFEAGQATRELLVIVGAPGFEVDCEHRAMRVPREGPSETVEFRLVPRTPGKQTIDVKFFAGVTLLGHCAVPTEVAGGGGRVDNGALGGAPTLLLEPLEGELAERHGGADAVLFVAAAPDGRLKWTFTPRGGAPTLLGFSPQAIDTGAIAGWTQQQGELIKDLQLENLSRPDIKGAIAQLTGIGAAVFEQIAPPAVAGALSGLSDQTVLAVETDADWIPWELLACSATEPLWGDRFVLARLPRISGEMHPQNVAPPTSVPVAMERAVLVVGDKVANAGSMAKLVFGSMSGRVCPLLETDWPTLQQHAAQTDMLHFACHGRGQPYYLSYGPKSARRLLPAQARQLGLRYGTVVFANACNSAAPRLLLTAFQSFGQAFYLVGARPFIGTIGPVPMNEAAEFAGMFYEAFALNGLPAGQAMVRARERARKQFQVPIWLFYCLYGNASVTRRWRVPA